jgi:hypothetical protein
MHTNNDDIRLPRRPHPKPFSAQTGYKCRRNEEGSENRQDKQLTVGLGCDFEIDLILEQARAIPHQSGVRRTEIGARSAGVLHYTSAAKVAVAPTIATQASFLLILQKHKAPVVVHVLKDPLPFQTSAFRSIHDPCLRSGKGQELTFTEAHLVAPALLSYG